MKTLTEELANYILYCLMAHEEDGLFVEFRSLLELQNCLAGDDQDRSPNDFALTNAEACGLRQTDERAIYYYVADRELFFARLVELYGQDQITQWLLDNEET